MNNNQKPLPYEINPTVEKMSVRELCWRYLTDPEEQQVSGFLDFQENYRNLKTVGDYHRFWNSLVTGKSSTDMQWDFFTVGGCKYDVKDALIRKVLELAGAPLPKRTLVLNDAPADSAYLPFGRSKDIVEREL